jgi:hypothetical protein
MTIEEETGTGNENLRAINPKEVWIWQNEIYGKSQCCDQEKCDVAE